MSDEIVPILGIMIPIVAIIMGVGMIMLKGVLDYRRRRETLQLYHAERMAAIEKGLEVPALPAELFQDADKREARKPTNYLFRGWLLLLIGISICAAMLLTGDRDGWWGLIPAGIGVAYLLTYWVDPGRGTRAPSASQPPSSDDPKRPV
jgi:uncharacterized protein DUF6249